MPRYFIEVSYKGTNYSGFQIQKNANSIQSEIENALQIFFKQSFSLTGASRTDAGVHACQNFFHFDSNNVLSSDKSINKIKDAVHFNLANLESTLSNAVYNLNAILPWDITIKNLFLVPETAHCRYDAVEREYKYFIYWNKNPFLKDRAYYFPYKLKLKNLELAAEIIRRQQDFTSFSKRSTQVKNFFCTINKSCWTKEKDMLVYNVSANRFLRGMVRGLVGTMLKFGRELISEENFTNIFDAHNSACVDFSAPAHGLFLNHINYPGKT